jgi:RHS repeat-associated protein
MSRCARLAATFALFFATPASFAITCTTTCEPDPSFSGYVTTVQNRVKVSNTRGKKGVFGPTAGTGVRAGAAASSANGGSESYNYDTPILSLRGRNGLDVNLTLHYNSAVWTTNRTTSTVTGATLNGDRDFPSYGFRLGYGYLEYDSTDDFYTLTEEDGSKHKLAYADSISYQSDDNTYIRFYPGTGVLRYRNGFTVFYELIPDASNDNLRRPYQLQDTNGNYISVSYKKNYWVSAAPVRAITTANIPTGRPINDPVWIGQEIDVITDTLGRTIQFAYTTYRLTSITQGSRTWTFDWDTNYVLKYNFSFSVTNSPTSNDTTHPQKVLIKVTMPNLTKYNFIYGDWAIVKKIEQQSSNGTVRSYVSYNYPTSATQLTDHPTFTQQTVSPDGTATYVWTHASTKSSGVITSYSITDPTGLKTKTNLDSNGLVSSIVTSNGTTTYRTLTNTWTGTPGSNARITTVLTTLNDTSQQSKVVLAYDSYGSVNDVKEYDFGLALTREVATTYSTDTALVSDRILDRATQIRVYDGAGSLKARTDFTYDGGTLVDRSGTLTGHSSNFGTSKTDRGNITAVTRYADAAGATGSVVRNSTYDILGNLTAADMDCCNQRTWAFSSADSYSFPTSTTAGTSPSLETDFEYTATSLPYKITDPNGKITTLTYDNMDRLTQVTRPDSVNITTSFDDISASPAVTSTSPIDSTPRNSISLSTFNGLGWLTKEQLKDNSSTVISTVDRTYDQAGRLASVSNPYVSGTPLVTTYSYDGAGRLLKAIPPDGSSTSNNWTYGYFGNQVTVTDPANKQRRNYSDTLGRLVRVDEPGGTPASGSVTFSGTEQSKLTNVCHYDPELHRNVCDRLYDSGYASVVVNGHSNSVWYNQDWTSATIASSLASAINADISAPVAAGYSGSVLNLTSKASGVDSNYSLSASVTYDSTNFAGPSFTATPSGSALTGGVDTAGTPSITNPFATYYTYNVLDGLTQVSQGVQTRTYAYNSMGELTSATTPESGTVSYTYTDFGGVYQRTDARSQVTTYCYDGLNRLSKISYANDSSCTTPNLQYHYDEGGSTANAMGRLTSTVDSVGGDVYAYDQLGRVTQVSKTMDSTVWNTLYTYNLAGEVTQIQYPSGRQVNQSYDSIGRRAQVSSGTTNYFTASSYSPASELLSGTYGNSVAATFTYNSRLQLASLAYTNGSATLFGLTYAYGSGNNGQIQAITDNVDSTRSMTYTYDEWSRLKTAQAGSGPNWKIQFIYDRYGNRTQQNVQAGSAPAPQTPTSTSTNRLTGVSYGYDNSGNLIADGTHNYAYDAENRIATVDPSSAAATYAYDASSLRIKKVVGTGPGVATYYIFSGTKVIAEYSSSLTTPDKEYIYWGGNLVATIAGSTTTYQHADHLSTRYETDSSAGQSRQFGHFPFGEAWYESGTTSKWNFTSYERDSESGRDYAIMRSYSSTVGRFTAADRLAGNVYFPQSMNRYTYTMSDPVDFIDPLGLETVCTTVTDTNGNFVSMSCSSTVWGNSPSGSTSSSSEPGNAMGRGMHDRGPMHWIDEFESIYQQKGSCDGTNQPPETAAPRTVGVGFGATAAGGTGNTGSVATASGGVMSSTDGTTSGYVSNGASGIAANGDSTSVIQGATKPTVIGVYFGAGAEASVSNGTPGQNKGDFFTGTWGVGLGLWGGVFTLSVGENGTYNASISKVGPGIGAIFAIQTTNTTLLSCKKGPR